MSAIILPFARPAPVTLSMRQAERAEAAAWAARLVGEWGGTWRVETHLGEDGEAWIGIVTPSSPGLREEDLSLSWLISRRPEGVSLTRMPSGRVAGTFRDLAQALATVERAEKQPRALAYHRS
ncbi:hypothetical protein SAMN02745194_04831 [Roseomonas rosea]|uniref:Uncharacterized protein n=1 Tax=Muricoccus roseus TaxID=198092 RepID=A0A1M6S474_9PROT|nr:hypothetical protein [Roseomonas rosea]SHK39486.1 hypothetical protein SAMN02745194_04831 [Roseomonas rosea]